MTSYSINFHSTISRGKINAELANTCWLTQIKWNDYGFYTSFSLYFINNEKAIVDIGRVRIMHVDMGTEDGKENDALKLIPETFETLGENFCSLGNQNYYENLSLLPDYTKFKILSSLKDCAYNSSLFNRFYLAKVMQESLMRDADEQKIRILFPSIIKGDAVLTPFHFQFSLNKQNQKIDIKVEPHSTPPSNIHVLIGRNGVGKTRLISGIMDELTKIGNPISESGTLKFINTDASKSSEKFVNLVIVVFSAFDHFTPPPLNNNEPGSISAHYIGLKSPDGKAFKSPEHIAKEFKCSVDAISGSNAKQMLWQKTIEILNSDPIFRDLDFCSKNLSESSDKLKVFKVFDMLSSGHRIVLLTITRLVELVDEKTLVLIDEPENHLHPPLLSSFIRSLSDLLIRRNGVALVATHSPVVLQEVPGYCTTKIDRVGSIYNFNRPKIETYAENIDVLTREIFGLEVENSGFYKVIKERIEANSNYTYRDFLDEFNSNVGAEGRALAKSLIALRKS
ncbi:AAA family ATPase [Fulvivirga sp. 29W222]|uniref:AAA family ATPase n=1 Tax=Fulvivirga marina TaxID=2494733 RepID=A0A937FUZ4_9BACT|nr:AAA family ATPase [Fulvivirga marina]MBL6444696.1 AAA family ATPase [Fulvivirga marina]